MRGFDPTTTERYHPQIGSWRGTYEEDRGRLLHLRGT